MKPPKVLHKRTGAHLLAGIGEMLDFLLPFEQVVQECAERRAQLEITPMSCQGIFTDGAGHRIRWLRITEEGVARGRVRCLIVYIEYWCPTL
jgi:hypothetical protein